MHHSYADQIIDSIYALVYAINYDTYEIIYANYRVKKIFPNYREGDICYQHLFDRDTPCPNCPLHQLENQLDNVTLVMWLEKLKKWMQFSYKDCTLTKEHHYGICTAVDISEIKSSIDMTERVLNGVHAAAYTVGIKDYKIQYANQELRTMLPKIKLGDPCYRAL